MNYQTFRPISELSALVKCYWTLECPRGALSRQRIVPDGCMEMIFHHGDLYLQYLGDGNSIVQPRCFIMGQLTRPLEIEPTGDTHVFAVRFYPDGFSPLATLHIKEMYNKAVTLHLLFGKEGLDLEQNVLDARSVSAKIRLIEEFILLRLTNDKTVNRIVKATVDTILSAGGRLSVDELARQIDVHRRQLERKFASNVGLSPKKLCRIIRLQASLKMLLNCQYDNLTPLAYESEYYDQAHFIKEFKTFTGLTPKQLYSKNLELSSVFYSRD